MSDKKIIAIVYHQVNKQKNPSYFTKYHRIIDNDTSHVARYTYKVLAKHNFPVKIFPVGSYKELTLLPYDSFSCVFNLIDSKELENRALRFFDKNKILRTGCNYKAIYLSNDKIAIKRSIKRAGLFTPRWLEVGKNQNIKSETIALEYPIIVKLVYEHCSVGITSASIAENFTRLVRIVNRMKKMFNQNLLLEEFIFGREFHATVLETGKKLITFPLAELTFKDENRNPWNIYGFEEKWAKRLAVYKSCIFIAPPKQLAQSTQKKILKDAKTAFTALGFSGYARFDIRYNPNSRRWYFLDANVNAGYDPHPREAMTTSVKAAKKTMDWFVVQIANNTLKKL